MSSPRTPAALDAWLLTHGGQPSRTLDQLCAQFAAHTSLLYWHTDLGTALAEARRTQRPILSLRLLGRLDEELSCANSRFFRRLLYPEPRINRVLRERFVLHWQSVRAVPKVTIELGDGRKIVRTITGNSLHLVLDPQGRPVDALPGLVAPDVFLAQLETAHGLARIDRRALAQKHQQFALARVQPPQPTRAVRASMVAMTKHRVEMPVLRAISPVEIDTQTNLQLHTRISDTFARGTNWTVDTLVAWIYRDLFLMPLEDPFLGLDVADPV